MPNKNEWWRGAVFYQIYPRSFYDANNDGVGDLKGITAKLDYVAGLGVDALWISPFFQSPMKDFGYDVSDYRAIDPLFGTMEDFDALLTKAHDLGLKLVIDFVMPHSSDQHEWFQESRQNRNNPKADWYIWADPKPDGTPPNNWQAHFGGPSWSFDVRRGQYYFHNFLAEQPALNLRCPGVKQALFNAARFWLDKGVDGFRLDAALHYFCDPALKDTPPNPKPASSWFDHPTPFSMQHHEQDIHIPDTLSFMEEFRALLDQYEGRMTVAEIGGENGPRISAEYTDGPHRLHTAYNFNLITGDTASAKKIRAALENFLNQPGDSWPSWAFSNHDVIRVASRWHENKSDNDWPHDPHLSRVLIAALGSLYGSLFIYQGEELGLPESAVPFEKLQDPFGKYLWPEWQGRDGCRTPIPWDSVAPQAGFNAGTEPWLPIDAEQKKLAVSAQEQDENSTLNFTRKFLKWRKAQPALIWGDIEFHDAGDDKLLAFTRTYNGTEILCLFNLDDGDKRWKTTELGPYGFSFSGSESFSG